MNIASVRNQINKHIGAKATIKCNLGRNKFENYNVVIKEIYKHIFLVEVDNKTNKFIKSFSYSDVITKTIKIDYKKIAF